MKSNLEKRMAEQVQRATEFAEVQFDGVENIVPSFWEGGLELWLDIQIDKVYRRFLWRDEEECLHERN